MDGLDSISSYDPSTSYMFDKDDASVADDASSSEWMSALNDARQSLGNAQGNAAPPIQLAQAEGAPQEEPVAREAAPEDMSEEDIENAKFSESPKVRTNAYNAAKQQLAAFDPTNPNAGTDLSAPGWSPSIADISRVQSSLNDARYARSLGISPAQYRDLASDPVHGGASRRGTEQERSAVITAWQSGQFDGPPTRSANPKADFDDANGNRWDVKSFNSQYRIGFSLPLSADNVDSELREGQKVIINTENMTAPDVASLQAEGLKRGWSDRVIYVNPSISFLK